MKNRSTKAIESHVGLLIYKNIAICESLGLIRGKATA